MLRVFWDGSARLGLDPTLNIHPIDHSPDLITTTRRAKGQSNEKRSNRSPALRNESNSELSDCNLAESKSPSASPLSLKHLKKKQLVIGDTTRTKKAIKHSSSDAPLSPNPLRFSSLFNSLKNLKNHERSTSKEDVTTETRTSRSVRGTTSRSAKSAVRADMMLPTLAMSVGQFLQYTCPPDVLRLIMAFSGPQTAQALVRTNQFFYQFLQQEETWRVMCEELYKWRPDDDTEPTSWKEYYVQNPCVPVDYPTISMALRAVASADREHCCWQGSVKSDFSYDHIVTETKSSRKSYGDKAGVSHTEEDSSFQLHRSVCILLRPGEYKMRHPLVIHAADDAEPIQITIRTMCLHKSSKESADSSAAVLMSFPDISRRIMNEPLIRVEKGDVVLKNISLHHASLGMDIWNGNAAIHLCPCTEEPSIVSHDEGVASKRSCASVHMEDCHVTSTSGRGIVVVDGASLSMRNSLIEHCAATGVYVGGRHTRVELVESDIINNGIGNHYYESRSHYFEYLIGTEVGRHHPLMTRGGVPAFGGIPRGHSGIYLEQEDGHISIDNCSIAGNSAAGISVISHDVAMSTEAGSWTVQQCDVVSNGCAPVEFLVNGNNQSDELLRKQNHLGAVGVAPARSSLLRNRQKDGSFLYNFTFLYNDHHNDDDDDIYGEGHNDVHNDVWFHY